MLAIVRLAVSIPVPDMTMHEGPPPFSAHAKLRGGTMPAERYATLSEPARARLGEALGRFFAELHSIDRAAIAAAGAMPVEVWRTDDAALSFAWPELPATAVEPARLALRDYGALPPDPLGEVYGFFDAHGWNMAYDGWEDRLSGIFDFADSGFGPPHREFVQLSLIDPELTVRSITVYERLTGRAIDRRRVFLLIAAQRLSEFAGMVETGGDVAGWRDHVAGWFDQAGLFGWVPSGGTSLG